MREKILISHVVAEDHATTFIPPPEAVEIFAPGGSIPKLACLAISSCITVCVAPVSGQVVTITPSFSFPAGANHNNRGGVGLL